MALREKNPAIKIALADPPGAALYEYYQNGVLKAEGSSITEGIGQGRVTANLQDFQPDFSYRIEDREAVEIVFSLMAEGLCLGASSGVNIAGAIRLARELGPGHVIGTILCDHGMRYQSKLYNHDFLSERDLPLPGWIQKMDSTVPDVFVTS